MSEVTFKVQVKPYLKEFFESNFGNPVRFPNKSYLNKLIHKNLKHQANYEITSETTGNLEIIIPFNESKNIKFYSTITSRGQREIKRELKDLFYTSLISYVQKSKKKSRQ